MKTVTFPIRLNVELLDRLRIEADRRHKSLADLFRDLITLGLPALPPVPEISDYEAAQAAWDSLGPPPEINYDELPKDWRRGFGGSGHEGQSKAVPGARPKA